MPSATRPGGGSGVVGGAADWRRLANPIEARFGPPHGRGSLAPVFGHLNTYETTTHFNGQSTVSLDGDRATAESYCLAHHLSVDGDGQRSLMIASIRYLDEFVKQDGGWLFAERRLMVDWTETRPSVA
ncbi:nuclear transport factor 2 family protein [Streptomyces sp. NPDC001312]|uniref:nuclear transport factor 2 family protein n=1 Tax=Streptomyces sp. NPDC001312 TaxID=3364561 RepID=UPI00368D6774